MLVIMKNDATEEQVTAVIREIEALGYRGIPIPGVQRTTVSLYPEQFAALVKEIKVLNK